MTYTNFKPEWNGRVVDFDHVYAYQCVDLILQYAYENGVTGIWGNAIDYRNAGAANVKNLEKAFDWHPGQDVQVGDIAVLRTNGTAPGDLSGYGHIGIVDSLVDAGNFKMLEQNGATGNGQGQGNDKISVWRSIPKSRVIGVWRPKPATAPPTPAPATGSVFLPSSVRSWRLYPVGGTLVPGTEKALLRPDQFPPGLTYKIEGWVADKAVIITTQMFGRGTIWVKDTDAQIK